MKIQRFRTSSSSTLRRCICVRSSLDRQIQNTFSLHLSKSKMLPLSPRLQQKHNIFIILVYFHISWLFSLLPLPTNGLCRQSSTPKRTNSTQSWNFSPPGFTWSQSLRRVLFDKTVLGWWFRICLFLSPVWYLITWHVHCPTPIENDFPPSWKMIMFLKNSDVQGTSWHNRLLGQSEGRGKVELEGSTATWKDWN